MGFLTQLGRDFVFLKAMIRFARRLMPVAEDGSITAADMVEGWAARTPEKEALVFEEHTYTYADYNAEGNRWAHWARAQGLRKGDVVALFMENRPEYLFASLGLQKIGVTIALINTNLTGAALAHSVNIAKARVMILGAELCQSFDSAKAEFEPGLVVWTQGGSHEGTNSVDVALPALPVAPLGPEAREGLTGDDICFFIYTSGTTGLPKAARFSHRRMQSGSALFSLTVDAKDTDRVYVCLPLYHSAGGVAAPGIALFAGGTIVLARKFSATNFWWDCERYEVTVFQYIGELCRYLLNTDACPHECNHKIRICVGNGLRPEVWGPFQARFKLPRIVEFYGATEGNVMMFNFDGYPGAVGRIPWFAKKAYERIHFVRFDYDSEMPVRGEDGFCIECETDEVGEVIGHISDEPGEGFEGYGDRKADEKKILRNVFEEGDMFFRTGDLMRMDKNGYVYFIDRIGDTFRWKGENVATSEVGEALSRFDGVEEANIYGVHVPGADGRAGMAALVAMPGLDIDKLSEHISAHLPAYARPLFLRLLPQMEITGTFKHRKVDLQKEGFDPSAITDPLYFFDDVAGVYVPLDAALYEKIKSGSMRL